MRQKLSNGLRFRRAIGQQGQRITDSHPCFFGQCSLRTKSKRRSKHPQGGLRLLLLFQQQSTGSHFRNIALFAAWILLHDLQIDLERFRKALLSSTLTGHPQQVLRAAQAGPFRGCATRAGGVWTD